MIFTNDISDQPWDLKGYEGLQNIGEQYGVDIFYEENVTNQHEIIDVVDDFARKGTNLIFGHGHIYGRTFVEIADEFPGEIGRASCRERVWMWWEEGCGENRDDGEW